MISTGFRSFQDVPRPQQPIAARAWAAILAVPQPIMRRVEFLTGCATFFALGMFLATRM